MPVKPKLTASPLGPAAAPAGFRSGAVARMSGIPVSTLRIWEQRYQAVGPITAPSGHRLYSAADVERVVLLRKLTERGHAIGLLAGLDMDALQQLSRTYPADEAPAPRRTSPLRIVVVGQALATRLERPSVARHWGQAPVLVAVFDSLHEATQAPQTAQTVTGSDSAATDLLLWHAPELQIAALPELKAAQSAWQAKTVAVAHRFANADTRKALAHTGAHMVREPADDDALGAWLAVLESSLLRPAVNPASQSGQKASASTKRAGNPSATNASLNAEPGQGATAAGKPAWSLDALDLFRAAPQRRFDDASLTAFASLPSSVACDCPGHVADLLMQIASFESYSAGCANRNAADAELHGYLQRVAAAARLLFESALERVAIAEGYPLPASAAAP